MRKIMRKIILTLGAVALLSVTACKKEETAKTEISASAETPIVVNGIEVPKFNSADAQKSANEYAGYYSEILEASKSGDAAKAKEMYTKLEEWSVKQTEIASKMTPEDTKIFSEFIAKLAKSQKVK